MTSLRRLDGDWNGYEIGKATRQICAIVWFLYEMWKPGDTNIRHVLWALFLTVP